MPNLGPTHVCTHRALEVSGLALRIRIGRKSASYSPGGYRTSKLKSVTADSNFEDPRSSALPVRHPEGSLHDACVTVNAWGGALARRAIPLTISLNGDATISDSSGDEKGIEESVGPVARSVV